MANIIIDPEGSKERQRFDLSYLHECISNDEAKLIGSYDKVTRNVDISFKCKCGNSKTKNFRQLAKTGAKCDDCIKIQKKEKRILTCMELYNVSHPSKCPEIVSKQVSSFRETILNTRENLETTHPDLLKEWDYEKNIVKPSEVTSGSKELVNWKCSNISECGCPHEWECRVHSRTISNCGCPYCSGNKICIHKSIAFTHPEISKQWHKSKNGSLKPEDVSKSSDKEVWWLCDKTCPEGCLHEYTSTIGNKINGGNGCPFCSYPIKKHCIHTSLVTTHPELVKEWHPSNEIQLENVGAGSSYSVLWQCLENKDHIWEAIIYSRVYGNGCPMCQCNNISKKQLLWLKIQEYRYGKKIKSAINGGETKTSDGLYKWDGEIKEDNIIFEFWGDFWHGNPYRFNPDDINPKNKKTFKELYEETMKKRAYILEHKHELVEIWEREWDNHQKILKSIKTKVTKVY